MIPDENNESTGSVTNLMTNEKRKLTLENVVESPTSSRLRSGSKRYSEPSVGGAVSYQNPWDENKRVGLTELSCRKKSNLPGSFKELGKGLNRKL